MSSLDAPLLVSEPQSVMAYACAGHCAGSLSWTGGAVFKFKAWGLGFRVFKLKYRGLGFRV